MTETCRRCWGRGELDDSTGATTTPRRQCDECKGSGRVEHEHAYTLGHGGRWRLAFIPAAFALLLGCDGMPGDKLMGFRQPHTELRIDPNTGSMVYSSERDTELSASSIDFGAFKAKNLRVVGNATNPTRANAALMDAALPLLIAERQRVAARDALVAEKVGELFDLIRDLAPYLKQAPAPSPTSGPATPALSTSTADRIGAVLRDIRDVVGPRFETERVP